MLHMMLLPILLTPPRLLHSFPLVSFMLIIVADYQYHFCYHHDCGHDGHRDGVEQTPKRWTVKQQKTHRSSYNHKVNIVMEVIAT